MFVHCALCQTQFPPGEEVCPACGSNDIMIGIETPTGTKVSASRDSQGIRLFGKGDPAYKQGGRFLRHHVKMEWSPQRQQMEYVERVFNKIQGTYDEVYYHAVTGEITFEKHVPITDQSAHGRRGQRR